MGAMLAESWCAGRGIESHAGAAGGVQSAASQIPHFAASRGMSDIDLAILGAAPQRFDEYETRVRAEYAWVPDEIFRVKRRGILAGFLARKLIFNTPRLHQLFEHQARTNLAGSIENLRQPDSAWGFDSVTVAARIPGRGGCTQQ